MADTAGEDRDLADFDVVWYHQGDAIRRTANNDEKLSLQARREDT